MFLGAQRALLLQVAHPKVGQAVQSHSTFRERPLTRLWATADTMLAMVWGRDDEPEVARQRIMGIHDHIHGALVHEAGSWPAGATYTAHDPRLLRWVWGTLVETSIQVHDRLVRVLSEHELRALYDDWCRFATFFGIPAEMLPDDLAAFRSWYHVEHAALEVSPEARAVGAAVLDPPLWFVPDRVKRAHARFAAGLLDPRLRDGYGIDWTARDETWFDREQRVVAAFWARVPGWRRHLPYAYMRARRLVAPVVDAAAALSRR